MRKLLCLIGWHDWRFVRNDSLAHPARHEDAGRPTAGFFVCYRCGKHRWHWYLWARRRAIENGGII